MQETAIAEGRYLGKLCKKGHEYEATGQSLRYIGDRSCVECSRTKASDYTLEDLLARKERFWSKVQKTEGCWEWQAATRGGYGLFRVGYCNLRANRVALELTKGEKLNELLALHTCDNPRCCRPDHLYAGTSEDNEGDKDNRNRRPEGVKHGRATLPSNTARGENVGGSKLQPQQVKEIRRLRESEGMTLDALASQFGVSKRNIKFICEYKTWTHVS